MRKRNDKFRKQVVAVLLVSLILAGCGSIEESEMNQVVTVGTAVQNTEKQVDVTETSIVEEAALPMEMSTPEQTEAPTSEPSKAPSVESTAVPTAVSTEVPTPAPTAVPTAASTEVPTPEPTAVPTAESTQAPTVVPTAAPTKVPTLEPTAAPTAEPIEVPTPAPTAASTAEPTEAPTPEPTAAPTAEPTEAPAKEPESTSVPAATWPPEYEIDNTPGDPNHGGTTLPEPDREIADHEHEIVEIWLSHPTCTKTGYVSRKCKNCDYVDEERHGTIKALGHKMERYVVDEGDCGTNATVIERCSVCGKEDWSKLSFEPCANPVHEWTTGVVESRDPNTLEKIYTEVIRCANCGRINTE